VERSLWRKTVTGCMDRVTRGLELNLGFSQQEIFIKNNSLGKNTISLALIVFCLEK
jgi:hypothetical protein